MIPKDWNEKLAGRIPPALADEIDEYEMLMGLRRQGRVSEKLFAEARLRRGVYGQRYDNGQRHDGLRTRELAYPHRDILKGPDTLWDAPGMQRIKIPLGRLTAEQLEVIAQLAEEYSDGILHVTTRQDIQLHFVHIEDTPNVMRRLAAVGITTREACGNAVRNVTACPYAGVCAGEAFDTSPYAEAMAYYLLGHPDTQDFGRKFKISFSGCEQEACGLIFFHDLGLLARTRTADDGRVERGFEVYVGGGLGAVPHQAKLLEEFVPEEEILPLAQAVGRVFARYGEKNNRSRARLKFLIKKWGIEKFREAVREERAALRPDERWTRYIPEARAWHDEPLRPPGALPGGPRSEAFSRWLETNTRPQRQRGYRAATVSLPLGDMTARQARALADLARKYTGDNIRLTVEQNVVLRWVSEADLPAFYEGLVAIGLGQHGAGTVTDVVACPGTDTCKLGISSSRGLAAELRTWLRQRDAALDPAVRGLRVKASGCFNACGQHHVADIGFLGVSRNVRGRRVPHFHLVVGGQWARNGARFGLGIGAVPSRNVPKVTERLMAMYVEQCQEGESFQDFVDRTGKAAIRQAIADLLVVPPYEVDPSFYRDWGDPREYTTGDMGVGECAGEVVPFVEFGLQAGEQQVFEAQIALDQGDAKQATAKAWKAMLTVAAALLRHRGFQVRDDDEDEIVAMFREHFHDTGLFHDPYAGGKFGAYLLRIHAERPWEQPDAETARQTIEEAQLFVEAGHACYERMSQMAATVG